MLDSTSRYPGNEEPTRSTAAPRSADAAAAARTVRVSSSTPAGSSGEAVTVANGTALPDERVREHHRCDLRRVDGRLGLRQPVGQPLDRGAVPDHDRRVEPRERAGRVARRRRHRRREDDDVRRALAQDRVRRVTLGIRCQHAGVDDVEVPAEQVGVAADDALALLPETGGHLVVEQREVAGDEADRGP